MLKEAKLNQTQKVKSNILRISDKSFDILVDAYAYGYDDSIKFSIITKDKDQDTMNKVSDLIVTQEFYSCLERHFLESLEDQIADNTITSDTESFLKLVREINMQDYFHYNINELKTKPLYRNKGLASNLINETINLIKENHPNSPILVTLIAMSGESPIYQDRLVSFYEKAGFKTIYKYPNSSWMYLYINN